MSTRRPVFGLAAPKPPVQTKFKLVPFVDYREVLRGYGWLTWKAAILARLPSMQAEDGTIQVVEDNRTNTVRFGSAAKRAIFELCGAPTDLPRLCQVMHVSALEVAYVASRGGDVVVPPIPGEGKLILEADGPWVDGIGYARFTWSNALETCRSLGILENVYVKAVGRSIFWQPEFRDLA